MLKRVRQNINKLWRVKGNIFTGVYNTIFVKNKIEIIAAQRNKICESNVCGYYDKNGELDVCYVKGKRCCGACGCNLDWKQRDPGSSCGLTELNLTPLWKNIEEPIT